MRATLALVAVCTVVVGLYLATIVLGVLLPQTGAPRADFIAFHDAARMALAGDAAGAYDWSRLRLLQAQTLGVAPDSLGFLGWVNPPPFFFFVLPFGLLPYAEGWFAWVLVTMVVLGLAMRSVAPGRAMPAAMFALAMPAVLICIGLGQNGLLTAALLAWVFALLDRRPVLAGVALGLLTYKPQFGLLLPVVLAVTGRWRVFGAAAGTAVLLAGAATLAFGPASWTGFLGALARNDAMYLGERHVALERIQSVYAFVYLVADDRALAWAVHGAFAGTVAVFVLWLWARRPEGPAEARSAAALAASFLMTPFGWVYDASALGVAAVFLAMAALRDGWLRGERILLLAACLLPGAMLLGLNRPLVVPAAWLLILACAWRRDRAWRLSRARTGSPSAGT